MVVGAARNSDDGRGMELRQLGYFLAVAEEESFTRAAERMDVAQPGISQQIRRLERDLGEPLFERSSHTVRLTEAGEAFLPYARAALTATHSGRAALAELRGLVKGKLSLGVIQGPPGIDLAALLAEFHAQHPGVEVTLREQPSDLLLEAVKRGDYHAAVVGLPEPQSPDDLSIQIIAVEPLVLVTSSDHPLASRQHATIKDLRDQSIVALTRGAGIRRIIETACNAAGFAPWISFETSDVHLLTDLVAHGLGVTIVPRSIAKAGATRQQLRIITIKSPLPERHTALAWRTSSPLSPAAHAFVTLARETLNAPATHPTEAHQVGFKS
jgi:DNA-binding transcriptional LysR family regulator